MSPKQPSERPTSNGLWEAETAALVLRQTTQPDQPAAIQHTSLAIPIADDGNDPHANSVGFLAAAEEFSSGGAPQEPLGSVETFAERDQFAKQTWVTPRMPVSFPAWPTAVGAGSIAPTDSPASLAPAERVAAEAELEIIHEIRDGDSLDQLAERYLGSNTRSTEIYA
ncbi:MAG: hypothetical protein KDA60_21805, partial [Planctomycetales bacterium]|nr:hypothetical protein [Planctomycetales bacterium]